MRYLFVLLIVIALFNSCKKQEDSWEGVDKAALYQDPTANEIKAVKEDWKNRKLHPEEFTVLSKDTIYKNGPVLYMISYITGGLRHYGSILIPNLPKPLGVTFNLDGYHVEIFETTIKMLLDTTNPYVVPCVYVFPCFRGNKLIMDINNRKFSSPVSDGKHGDAFDGATDDVISLLDGIITYLPGLIDTARIAARGSSRGGTVALLWNERDSRVAVTVASAAPTDWFRISRGSNVWVDYYDPTFQAFFLSGLKEGTKSIQEVRHKMIACSPVFFSSEINQTQLHYGEADEVVPVEQGRTLYELLLSEGKSNEVEFYTYPGRSHSSLGENNPVLQERWIKYINSRILK